MGSFSKLGGDFRNAKCNHCEQIVKICREDQPSGKAVNRMMQMHMKKCILTSRLWWLPNSNQRR